MTSIWDIGGNNVDVGYVNLRAASSAAEREMRQMLDMMWLTYEPYADPDFREGFARDPDARFWEMYLGCTLVNAGKSLLPIAERKRTGGQPDLCVLDGDRRIWIEAIAPDSGAPRADQVRGPTPINEGGGLEPAPRRQAQLRTTSALWTKKQAIDRYLREGAIGQNDVRLIAISAGRFGLYVSEYPLPLIMSAVFPIGDEFVSIDRETGNVIGQGFHTSLEIRRQGASIPRTAFLDRQFAPVSGIIWSRIGIGNTSRDQRPLTYIHNPLATVLLPTRWGVWDREFVTTERDDEWIAADILTPDSP